MGPCALHSLVISWHHRKGVKKKERELNLENGKKILGRNSVWDNRDRRSAQLSVGWIAARKQQYWGNKDWGWKQLGRSQGEQGLLGEKGLLELGQTAKMGLERGSLWDDKCHKEWHICHKRRDWEIWHCLVWRRQGLEGNYPYVQIPVESRRGSGHNWNMWSTSEETLLRRWSNTG